MKTTLGSFELSLNVSDLEKSINFYEALGFAQGSGDSQTWCEMHNGELSIGLYQGHVSSNLFTFFNPDVSAVVESLCSHGLAMEHEPEREADGSTGMTLCDPDGNRIYING